MKKLDENIGRIGVNNRYYILWSKNDVEHNTPELEHLADICIRDIIAKKAVIDKEGYPLVIVDTEKSSFLPEQLLNYYLSNFSLSNLDYKKEIAVCEAFRSLVGWNEISKALEIWVERNVQDRYFDGVKKYHNNLIEYNLKANVNKADISDELIQFACYVAIGHSKYGSSWDSVTVNKIFDWVTKLGSNAVAEIKKYGSGDLPAEIRTRKSEDFSCVANDAFATIKISVKKECEASYREVLDFICKLLKVGFPKSYSIEFRGVDKNYLPIKGLPKKGINQLFANASQYPNLLPLIEEYARLAINEYEWYNNFEGEICCMPGTFAVFSLALKDKKYFPLLGYYFDMCDSEHSSIQVKLLPTFIEIWGFNEESIPVFIKGICSYQEPQYNKAYQVAITEYKQLELLFDAKRNLATILYIKEKEKDVQAKLYRYDWKMICYAIWGKKEIDNCEAIIKKAKADEKAIYIDLFKDDF